MNRKSLFRIPSCFPLGEQTPQDLIENGHLDVVLVMGTGLSRQHVFTTHRKRHQPSYTQLWATYHARIGGDHQAMDCPK